MNVRLIVFIFCSFLLASQKGVGQAPTYQQHIRPIIIQHCAPCHQPGGVGPFSLLTYPDVAKRAKFIAKVTQIRYMPPFPADRTFQHYSNERGLSVPEIALIQAWVAGGMKEGTGERNQKAISAEPQVRPQRKPDLEVRMRNPYALVPDGREDFRYFHVPLNLPTDVWVEAIEFVPGNRQRLHHSRLMIDSTGTMAGLDGLGETDPRLRDFQRTRLADEFLYGWVPGNDRVTFPTGTAKRIRAGSDLLLNIHYAPTAKPETDQSAVRFYFTRQPDPRPVHTITLTENDISNQPFVLPANTKPTFYMRYGPLPDSLQLLSVMPHMHRRGQSIKAFAITPDGDAINLIKIDKWDYNWQMSYFFRNKIVLPKGSIILAEGTYDNTDQNPENPFRPAKPVGYGWNSTDEMMNLVFYVLR